MKPVTITLPDGNQKQYDSPVTPEEIAQSIGKKLAKEAVAARVNGALVDLNFAITADAQVALVTRDTPEGLEIIRHSTAHLLAQAVKELYPESQCTIGPVTEEGFYYDFDRDTQFKPEDLPKIEKRMAQIAKKNHPIQRQEVSLDEAVKTFQEMKEFYKVEIVKEIDSQDLISVYHQGGWRDLCRGPHLPNTSKIGKFKLLSIAGAYWRGDENNKMLQRIYGTAFASQEALDDHLHRLEEAKKRDHRKVGPEMELFAFMPNVAPAMPFYLPKGTVLYNCLQLAIRQQMEKLGFEEVSCPQLMTTELWKTSGHWDHFKENMFSIGEGEEDPNLLSLKPMNCPGHVSIYKLTKHSYRQLPIRYAEYTKVHRNERAGVTHGLFRAKNFSIDDGHIFCTEAQIESEALKNIESIFQFYRMVGFSDIDVKLATRPEGSLGSDTIWEQATKALQSSLEKAKVNFSIAEGEGAFYGPKIEFHIRDSLKRSWQCGTVQLDFNLPERFELQYTDKDGKARQPVMIHRAILGSFERFLGILIEHHAGHLPLWLCPVQVQILNVTEGQVEYVEKLASDIRAWGVRVETDLRNEKLGYKIREAQLKRSPLMIIVGNKEKEQQTLSVRKHTGETLDDLTLEAFKEYLIPKIQIGGDSH